MATGSPDYWATRTNRMNSILAAIAASLEEGGALVTALDSMDGKLDGIVDLTKLSDDETGLLAKLFRIDTVDGDGKNLLTKLDALDGKIDGQMDLDKMEAMSIFFDSGASKPRLQLAVENLDGTIGTLITKLGELVGIHSDTSDMVAYGEEEWDGTAGTGDTDLLCASANTRRNMLKITNNSANAISYVRQAGQAAEGYINPYSTVMFYDSPGVWLGLGTNSFSAREEWATQNNNFVDIMELKIWKLLLSFS